MAHLFSRAALHRRVTHTFRGPQLLANAPQPSLPLSLKNWLGRLMLLYGVPINYLVPDEAMLPPESIRFFYLDMNWIDAMVDGAFSIGRNLTAAASTGSNQSATHSFLLDQATFPGAKQQTSMHLTSIRADFLGVVPPPASLQVVSGFLLRSSVVQSYPGIGVNAFPAGFTPSDPTQQLLTILRMEVLGPQADTLICLIDGDAADIDVHEPPEGLHYGIDSYSYNNNTVTAKKGIYKYTQSGSTVTMAPSPTTTDISANFRAASPRVLMMEKLAEQIAALNGVSSEDFDSAEMGFEMTEGVGMVEFKRTS